MHSIFRFGAFRRLWCNALLNALSMGGDFVLIGWLALSATGSSDWVGIGLGLFFLPMMVFGVPAGGMADRFDRAILLRRLELAAAAILLVFALIYAFGGGGIALALTVAFVLGTLRAVHNPIRLSLAYDLVGAGYATPALAAVGLAGRVGIGIGALALGYISEGYGVAFAFGMMAVAHVLACLAIGRSMSTASRQTRDTSSVWKNLADSAAEVRRNRLLFVLIAVTAIIEIFGTSYSTVLPELAQVRFDGGIDGLGELHAASAVGAFFAAALLTAWPLEGRRVLAYAGVIAGLGVAIILLGWAPDHLSVLLVLPLIGFGIAAWDILTQSMMQRSVPDHLRGRAMGAWVFAIGSAPIGHIQIGFLATAIGLDWALYANGALVVVTIVVSMAMSASLRRL